MTSLNPTSCKATRECATATRSELEEAVTAEGSTGVNTFVALSLVEATAEFDVVIDAFDETPTEGTRSAASATEAA